MNILMLYPKFPAEAFWNGSRADSTLMLRSATMPPLGLLTIASYLPDDFQVRLIDRNVAVETDDDWAWADAVFLSLMLSQQEDYRVCVERARSHGKPVAVGGPFTHAWPEVAAADGDWVCYGEAEDIMPELVADLRAGRRGRRYEGGNKIDMTGVRPPRFDLLADINDYACIPIQFARGCPFRCEFCDIIEIYGRVPRTKTPGQLMAELDTIRVAGFAGHISLVDDNFIGNKKRVKAMLPHLAAWNRRNGYPYQFSTEASLDLADDDELMDLMADANMRHLFIGIETPDPRLLKGALKTQNTTGDPMTRLAAIRKRGMHVSAGFIVGFDGETRDVFDVQRNFIRDSGIGVAMAGLLEAIPHTQLSRRLRAEGRLLEGVHVIGVSTLEGMNFIPGGEMTKREYLAQYRAMIRELYTPKAFYDRIRPVLLSLPNRAPLRAHYSLWKLGLPILLREIYHLGIRSRETRRHFWKTLLMVAIRNPASIDAFGWDSYRYYYLRMHAAFADREVARYLDNPHPGDVLDEVRVVQGRLSAVAST